MNSPFAFPRWEALFSDWRILLDGFLNTVAVSALALLLALALGIVFGLFSTSHSRLLHGVDRVYVEIFQNTPLLIQLFFFFNGTAIPRYCSSGIFDWCAGGRALSRRVHFGSGARRH
jgi:aspartate/glutamate/glutamine transport system permease protein